MSSATTKNYEKIYHTATFTQNHLKMAKMNSAVFEAAFDLWRPHTLVLESVATYQLWIVSEGMRLTSQEVSSNPYGPTYELAASSGFLLCYSGLQRFNNHMDARNELSDPKNL